MRRTTSELERTKLQRLVREYERKGYEVTLHPDSKQLPPFLRDVRPDMIARKPGDSVVIEVKAGESLKGREDIRTLANLVSSNRGWRFELVVANAREDRSEAIDPTIISEDEVVKRIGEAERLLQLGLVAAAFVTVWVAVEAAARRLLQLEGKDVEKMSSLAAVKTLYALGFLERHEYEDLESACDIRNRVVHGFRAEDTALLPRIRGLISTVRRLEDENRDRLRIS
jgi:uncharacterized protein YutE (UPF0331/DUF86 family)